MNQTRLSSFFGKRPNTDNDESNVTPKTRRIDDGHLTSSPSSVVNVKDAKTESTSSPKTKRTWRPVWEKSFPWLRKKEVDGLIRAYCDWCTSAGKTNPFARDDSGNLQYSAFTRHETNPDHLHVVDGRRAQVKKQTVTNLVDKILDVENEKDESKSAQFRTMYYLAKNGQSLNQFNDLIELQRLNQCSSLEDKSKLYTSKGLQAEILDAINETVESVNNDIHHSPFVGIILDETTDITIHKKLNVYIQCLKAADNEPVVHFIDCVSVLNGKADTLVDAIVQVCQQIGLDCGKITTMASDGASVMTGKHNGVGAKFREVHSPRLIQVHCVAHKLALAAGQACRDITLLHDFQDTLKFVYRYFHNSPVRYNQLRAMEDLLEDENMRCLTLQEPASFRWLSLEAAVTAIMDIYPALVQTLESEAAKGNSAGNAEAKGLYNKIRPVTFILTAGFLQDVLHCIGKLSKVFQRDHVDVDTVNVMLESTLNKLGKLKVENGRHLQSVYNALQIREGYYREAKIQDRQNLRIQFQTAASDYLDKISNNLRDRFDKSSMEKLQLINTVLNPNCIPASGLASHGVTELELVCDFLGSVAGQKTLVDTDRMKDDFDQFKSALNTLKGKSLKDACVHIVNKYSDLFPDFVTLAQILLTAPLTSVACERGFSSQNRLKTKVRSSLNHETVTKLIRIMEEGPELQTFDPTSSIRTFVKAKQRRK